MMEKWSHQKGNLLAFPMPYTTHIHARARSDYRTHKTKKKNATKRLPNTTVFSQPKESTNDHAQNKLR